MQCAIASGLQSIRLHSNMQMLFPCEQPSVLLEISSLVNLNSGHTSNNRKGQLIGYYDKLVIEGEVVPDAQRTEDLIIRIACEHAGWEFV